MRELRQLVDELRQRQDTTERLGLEAKSNNMKWHFFGVALGYCIAAHQLERLLNEVSPPNPEDEEKTELEPEEIEQELEEAKK